MDEALDQDIYFSETDKSHFRRDNISTTIKYCRVS